MTSQQEDPFFQDYLKGDSGLSRNYHQSEQIESPETIDKLILDAARKEAGIRSQSISSNKVRPSFRMKPWVGSLAASVLIVVLSGILVHNTWQEDKLTTEDIFKRGKHIKEKIWKKTTSEPRMPMEEAEQSFTDQPVTEKTPEPLQSAAPAMVSDEVITVSDKASTSRLRLSAEKKQYMINAVEENDRQGFEQGVTGAAPAAKYGLSDKVVKPASGWLDEIVTLAQEQQLEKAKAELSRFIETYPHYPLNHDSLKLLLETEISDQ